MLARHLVETGHVIVFCVLSHSRFGFRVEGSGGFPLEVLDTILTQVISSGQTLWAPVHL